VSVYLKKLLGDLSAPVLAIIVTLGVISAGLVLMAWFWWFAPQAGRMGSLVVVGVPAYSNTTGRLYISVKNIGNAEVNITQVVLVNETCNFTQGATTTIAPGETWTGTLGCPQGLAIGPTVEGVIMSTAGTTRFTANVIA